ncbi:ATP-binding protein [Paracoccus ravus]|uniref:ATP-binding protein n=1 Tax=Paracoccus ravus TaxID=2447760 RepID=UPI00106E7F44|nr:ATP-binding protein [Paracoccus ravus]
MKTANPTPLIRHGAFCDAEQSIRAHLATCPPGQGSIIPLLGPTRVGKSELIHRLIETSPQGKSLAPQRTFARVDVPASVTARGLYAAILSALGYKSGFSERTNDLRDRLFRVIDSFGIEVIALDECSRIVEKASKLGIGAAADLFRSIADGTGASLILSGLPKFQAAIDHNEQLRDRATSTVLFKPYDWQNDDDRDAFVGTVQVVLNNLETSGIRVDLDVEDFVRRLYGASGGRIPVITRLVGASLADTPSAIRLADLRRGAAAMQQSGIRVSSFFESNEPDETDLVRSYAIVMHEAGLNFELSTDVGLKAYWDMEMSS